MPVPDIVRADLSPHGFGGSCSGRSVGPGSSIAYLSNGLRLPPASTHPHSCTIGTEAVGSCF
eukprot:1678030-Rhodomonas_salina.2